jgi:hypothetical protein
MGVSMNGHTVIWHYIGFDLSSDAPEEAREWCARIARLPFHDLVDARKMADFMIRQFDRWIMHCDIETSVNLR